jgi:hypothetical protein
MLNVSTNTSMTHLQVISIMSRPRQVWQEATDETSLLETDGNIGFTLADLINGFGLNIDEECQILAMNYSKH